MLGGLIMVHGDDRGLRLALIQVVVIAIRAEVVEPAARVVAELTGAGLRAMLDDRVDVAFGRRAIDWELKGVPVRVELGPRDLAAGTAVLVSRATGSRLSQSLTALRQAVEAECETAQDALLDQARAARDARVADVTTIEDAIDAATAGWARIRWPALGEDGERRLAESAVTVRCLQDAKGELPGQRRAGRPVRSGGPGVLRSRGSPRMGVRPYRRVEPYDGPARIGSRDRPAYSSA